MIVGNKYEIGGNKNDLHRPELQAVDRIAECIKDWNNGFYTVSDGKSFWLVGPHTKHYEI